MLKKIMRKLGELAAKIVSGKDFKWNLHLNLCFNHRWKIDKVENGYYYMHCTKCQKSKMEKE